MARYGLPYYFATNTGLRATFLLRRRPLMARSAQPGATDARTASTSRRICSMS